MVGELVGRLAGAVVGVIGYSVYLISVTILFLSC